MRQHEKPSMITQAEALRTDERSVRITWSSPLNGRHVSVYMGTDPASIDRSSPVAGVVAQTFADISDLDPRIRYFFELVPEGGEGLTTAERGVTLDGAVNFRDLGGYKTEGGHQVKWNCLYRADTLALLTPRDQTTLKSMGIKVVCDFRSAYEVELAPDRLPQDASFEYLNVPVLHGDVQTLKELRKLDKEVAKEAAEAHMIQGYMETVNDFPHEWGRVVKRLAQADGDPMVFHCTSGKDRTGTFAALILLTLGVPEETVIYDYALSGSFISRQVDQYSENIRQLGIDPKKILPFAKTPPEFIMPLLDHIRRVYRSAEEYFVNKAGVSRDTIKDLKQKLLV